MIPRVAARRSVQDAVHEAHAERQRFSDGVPDIQHEIEEEVCKAVDGREIAFSNKDQVGT